MRQPEHAEHGRRAALVPPGRAQIGGGAEVHGWPGLRRTRLFRLRASRGRGRGVGGVGGSSGVGVSAGDGGCCEGGGGGVGGGVSGGGRHPAACVRARRQRAGCGSGGDSGVIVGARVVGGGGDGCVGGSRRAHDRLAGSRGARDRFATVPSHQQDRALRDGDAQRPSGREEADVDDPGQRHPACACGEPGTLLCRVRYAPA